MKCLRCGYCCKKYCVAIVNDPEKGIVDDNLIMYDGNGQCRHLRGNKPGEYSCIVHNKQWYKKTPCYSHIQFERTLNDVCRIGKAILEGKIHV